MLAPAVHIMHQVWKGMAWVADDIDEDEERTRSIDVGEPVNALKYLLEIFSFLILHEYE